MYHNFEELLKDIKKKTIRKTIAVAAAHDREVLASASAARKEGIADFILIGQIAQIRTILVELGEVPDDWTIINEPDDFKAAQHAVLLASTSKADALMTVSYTHLTLPTNSRV